MKIKITLFFLILTNLTNSQIKVEYSTSIIGSYLNEETKKKNVEFAKNLEGIEDKISTYKFLLYINGGKSRFENIKTMSSDKNKYMEDQASIVIGEKEIYYRDNDKKIIINNCDVIGQRFNVFDDFNKIKWNITSESKIINNFECFKATWAYQKIDVIAWFCPKLPYAFGPMEYGNLPGLILELNRGKFVYLATKIYKDFNEIIKMPVGKQKTKKEIDKMCLEALENMSK